MRKTTQDLRTEFNKEIETLRKTRDGMKMKLKNPITPLKTVNAKEKPQKQEKSRLPGFKDKVEGQE